MKASFARWPTKLTKVSPLVNIKLVEGSQTANDCG